jgi:hypothetical protein
VIVADHGLVALQLGVEFALDPNRHPERGYDGDTETNPEMVTQTHTDTAARMVRLDATVCKEGNPTEKRENGAQKQQQK